MEFTHKNKYTLYIKLDNGLSDEIKNYYIQLCSTSLLKEDSGIDLCIPQNNTFDKGVHSINHKISCRMINNNTGLTTGYYMYPRSSIYNTPLMLANSIGIIDAGYSGNIIAKVRCFESNFNIIEGNKLFQICAPDLSPLNVRVLRNNEEYMAAEASARGANGFGSSGR